MEREILYRLASKMGITSPKIRCRAEEYMRLSQVKCTGLGNSTATGKAVICLELAATSSKFPLDKEYAIKLSGLNKKLYQSNLRSMEAMLGLNTNLGLRDLAVQYGCMEAVKVAGQILDRYEESLPAAQQQDLDLAKPLFTTAALFTACKCMKIKVDRKLAASSGVKKGIFDRLCTQMSTIGQKVCSEAACLKEPVKRGQKRQKTLAENFEQKEEAEVLPTSPKQRKEGESEESMKEDYEEWKRKILENALKSKQADASETSSN
ncbi:origin recognition complex subunit 6 isoform X2 [Clupea harengus]|uniref:Origin recognition complex subunit 6 n=1 Tax=Clupea harengus TaxID=7950 RepID=A0A8M1KDL2_CLUHA|nr:origin recognition complex subunit 6 isoform X2 [Clupea harengus]